MVNIEFYHLSKRLNSTLHPDRELHGSETLTGMLRDDTSILNPVIRINVGDVVPDWNYCYIPDFKRFYWIDDFVFDHGYWWMMCRVDVLGSFAEEIESMSAYVQRASDPPGIGLPYNDPNGTFAGVVSDDIYPAIVMTAHDSQNIPTPFAIDYTDGVFVVGVIAGKGYVEADVRVGGLIYYLLDYKAFAYIVNMLLTNVTTYTGVDADVMDPDLLKCVFNPLQYFVSVVWLPIELNALLEMILGNDLVIPNVIQYGWWGIDLAEGQAYILLQNSGYIRSEYNTVLKDHQNADRLHKYLSYAPYQDVKVYAYPFGEIPIDQSKFIEKNIRFVTQIDIRTGDAYLDIETYQRITDGIVQGNSVVYRQHGQIGVEMQLAQMGVDKIQTTATAVNTGASFLSNLARFNLAGAVESLSNGINNVIHQSAPQLLKEGTQGSMSLYRGMRWVIDYVNKLPVQEYPLLFGYPVYRYLALNRCYGFLQLNNPNFESAYATAEEIQMINDYLTNGFYLEENAPG